MPFPPIYTVSARIQKCTSTKSYASFEQFHLHLSSFSCKWQTVLYQFIHLWSHQSHF